MELLDIVNEKGCVVDSVTRDECHANPKYLHKTVQFTLLDPINKKVLITRRSSKKFNDPGKLCFLGEHLLSGESSYHSLKRSAKEELSFKITKNIAFFISSHVFRMPTQSEYVDFYLIKWNNQKLIYSREEISELKWVDLSSLRKLKKDVSEMTGYWIDNIDWEYFI